MSVSKSKQACTRAQAYQGSAGVVLNGIVLQALQDRSTKGKTFDFLQPRGTWTTQAHVLDEFLRRRAVTLEYIRANRDRLHHHAAPLGEMGLLDGYQWLLLLAAHTDRHVAQMQEALRNA